MIARYADWLGARASVTVEDTMQALGVNKTMAESILRTFGYARTPKRRVDGRSLTFWVRNAVIPDLRAMHQFDRVNPQGIVRPEKAKKVTFAQAVPQCSSPKSFSEWNITADWLPIRPAGFCSQCTPAYQAKMKAAGRCENPHVLFRMVDGDWEGYV